MALNLLSLANPTKSSDDFSDGMISLVSVLVIGVVCLLLYFLLPLCFFLNTPLAVFKLLLMLVLSLVGLIALRGHYDGENQFGRTEPGFDGVSTVQAMIYVIYSYQGFLNINCVSCDQSVI